MVDVLASQRSRRAVYDTVAHKEYVLMIDFVRLAV
jgi:hypothetical protein